MRAATDAPGDPGGRDAAASWDEDLLWRAFAAYNVQDADGLLALVSEDVDWPDGSGRLHGKAALRAYWAEQWIRTHTHDRPMAFRRRPDGRVAVRLISVVRSLDGAILARASFHYVFRIEGRGIVRLDIEGA